MPVELRNKSLESPALRNCGNPEEVSNILSSPTLFADADFVYIFAQEYGKNLCVDYYEKDKLTFLHYKVNNKSEFLHLHLIGYHYTPYFPATVHSVDQLKQNISLEENSNEPVPSETHTTPGMMTRYLVAVARPSHILPSWSSNNIDNTTFTHVQQLHEQPFAYKENLMYVVTYV